MSPRKPREATVFGLALAAIIAGAIFGAWIAWKIFLSSTGIYMILETIWAFGKFGALKKKNIIFFIIWALSFGLLFKGPYAFPIIFSGIGIYFIFDSFHLFGRRSVGLIINFNEAAIKSNFEKNLLRLIGLLYLSWGIASAIFGQDRLIHWLSSTASINLLYSSGLLCNFYPQGKSKYNKRLGSRRIRWWSFSLAILILIGIYFFN